MSKGSLRRAAQQQKRSEAVASAAPENTAPSTEASSQTEQVEQTLTHTDSDGTPREKQVATTDDVGSLEDITSGEPVAVVSDPVSGEVIPVTTAVDIPDEPNGGESIEALGSEAPSGAEIVQANATEETEQGEPEDNSGDGSDEPVTGTDAVDPAILAAMAIEQSEQPTSEAPASPQATAASEPNPPAAASPAAIGATPAAFMRLSSRNDPEAHALLKKATERRAAGETNNLTVNAAADLLRASSNDTAIVTIAKTDKGVTYTTKVPDCKEMKGLRRKGKDGYVGELTMAGRMLAMLEANGGSMQAEALHQAMVARYQNYDRGYLRGTGLKVYALWTVTEATAAATGGSPTPAVAAQGQAAA